MAVLKYRASDGTVKTLGINQSGGGGVTSVNGKTGAVTGVYDAENPPPYPVTSVNGKTGAVTGVYDADNQPPYPVTSVNGKTGAITIPSSSLAFANVTTELVGDSSNRHIVYYSQLPGISRYNRDAIASILPLDGGEFYLKTKYYSSDAFELRAYGGIASTLDYNLSVNIIYEV